MKLKVYLVLASVVLSLSWAVLVYGQTQKPTASRQMWEYKVIGVARVAEANAPYSVWWEVLPDGSSKNLAGPVTPIAKMAELGNQGWELVAVVPVSNHTGGFSLEGRGSADLAGFTSQLSYYFKRPK